MPDAFDILDDADGAPVQSAGRRVTLTRASDIRVRPVRWMWDRRLALGSLALVGGREGIGKSVVTLTLAADLTRGRLPGVFFGRPRAVIIAATEDSWEHTINPRLMAAGADLTRVFRVDVTTADGIDSGLSLPRDLIALEVLIAEQGAALLILDPLLSRLDTNLDTHKDAEVRLALEPLVKLTTKTQCCTVGLIHVNKSSSDDALTTLMGSRAFAAVARSVLFVMVDPDDDEGRKRLLGVPKNNLGQEMPTLSFHLVGIKVAETSEGDVWAPQLAWLGETDRSIKDAMAAAAESAGDKTATSEAADWLVDYLTEHGEGVDSALIKREGQKAGHSKDAIRRAKHNRGIVSVTSGFPRRAFWSLPVGATSGESASNALTASTASTGASLSAFGALNAVGAPPRGLAPTAGEGGDRERL
jgi:hypothetical protein